MDGYGSVYSVPCVLGRRGRGGGEGWLESFILRCLVGDGYDLEKGVINEGDLRVGLLGEDGRVYFILFAVCRAWAVGCFVVFEADFYFSWSCRYMSPVTLLLIYSKSDHSR